jgi:hypothetical protein
MNCDEIRERMLDVAAGVSEATHDESKHLSSCGACAGKMEEFRKTMALLDEWKAPALSPYFDVRMQARLREEMAKPQAGWLQWFRRPVLAAALTVALGLGVGLYFARGSGIYNSGGQQTIATADVQPGTGTAVSDLQALDNNHDMYSDFELLDDLQVQQDVVANP